MVSTMNDQQFLVVFDGQAVPEHELYGVKQRLKDIFKADRARVESLFAGKPVALKRNLSREAALKYQHMLKQAGVTVSVVRSSDLSSIDDNDNAVAPQQKPTEQESLFSLAPLGSDLVNQEKQQEPSLPLHIDHLALSPQQGNLFKPNERVQISPAEVGENYLDWELSQMGEDLLKQSEKQAWVEADVDTSALEFTDNSKPLSPPEKIAAVLIKTDHISLMPLEKNDT